MTTYLNKLAWLVAMLMILAWAFVPRIALAFPVMFPKAPGMETLSLPPVPSNDTAETDQ